MRVRAANANGPGAWATAISYSTNDAPPAAPAAPGVEGRHGDGFTVTWVEPARPTGASAVTAYKVQHRPAATQTWTDPAVKTVDVTDADATSKAITGLTASTTYHVRVAAVNGAGTGAWSTHTAAATTTAGVPNTPTMGFGYHRP